MALFRRGVVQRSRVFVLYCQMCVCVCLFFVVLFVVLLFVREVGVVHVVVSWCGCFCMVPLLQRGVVAVEKHGGVVVSGHSSLGVFVRVCCGCMVLLLYIVLFLVLGHDVFVVVFTVWLLHSVVDHGLLRDYGVVVVPS